MSSERYASALPIFILLISLCPRWCLAQSKATATSQDELSRNTISVFHKFDEAKRVILSGSATLGQETGQFTIQVSGDKAELLLPQAFYVDKEVAWDRHGSVTCEQFHQDHLVVRQSYGPCGFAVPWFFPFKVMSHLNRRGYDMKGKREAQSTTIKLTPGGIAPLAGREMTATLQLDEISGAITHLAYSFVEISGSRVANATVDYEQGLSSNGLVLPRRITRRIEAEEPLILTIQSVDVESR